MTQDGRLLLLTTDGRDNVQGLTLVELGGLFARFFGYLFDYLFVINSFVHCLLHSFF